MDKEKIIKELTTPQAILEDIGNYILKYTAHHVYQLEAVPSGESPEFEKHLDLIRQLYSKYPDKSLFPIHYVHWLMWAFADALAENNRKVLSLLFPDEENL